MHQTLIPVPEELRSSRLLLRRYHLDDAETVFHAIDSSREHLYPWLSWPPRIQDLDDAKDLCARSVAKWMLRTDLTFGIFSLCGSQFFGAAGLHDPDWDRRVFEIGYWLRASALGRGFARDAVRTLTSAAFQDLAASRVEIRCDPLNIPSRQVAEDLGFILEGHLREVTTTPQGNPRDTLVFAVIRQDFDRLQHDWKSHMQGPA